ncbi:MAG: transcription antitermination factor NusB [Acetatifactor sp.]|nr:transcription antitermination factor NusB [Acetatifactor sp.]
MSRREQREQIFRLLFRVEFNALEEMQQQTGLFLEQIKLPTEDDGQGASEQDAEIIEAKYVKIQEKLPELDAQINEKTEGWDTKRMGKVELAVLRLGLYEILYDDEVPGGVAVNEAVEIAKKYGQESSGKFVNAVLAKFMPAEA